MFYLSSMSESLEPAKDPQSELPPVDSAVPHKRRVRYKGKNPRRFEDKYKEHDPERYRDDVQKVIARGQTPAGMHRPICVDEIMQALALKPGQVGLDATLGFGGHAQQVLKCIVPGGRLYALDVDPLELPRTEKRLRELGYTQDTLEVRHMNFAGIQQVLAEAGRPFDFVLADLGVSSMQIDNPARGFTFKVDGPLDLRLNPERGKPASEYLLGLTPEKLEVLLWEHSDEPHAVVIAKAICACKEPIETTQQLRAVIALALQRLPLATQKDEVKKSCQRVFQALRIAVNDEFAVLEQLLDKLPYCLAPGGRVAILTFHSGEDRRVKKSFQALQRAGVYAEFSRDPVRPSPAERNSNPRSSCAKLRWAVKA